MEEDVSRLHISQEESSTRLAPHRFIGGVKSCTRTIETVPDETSSYLPGLTAEVRFHADHPDIAIPPSLLRKYAREDHHYRREHAELVHFKAAHILDGYAIGTNYIPVPCLILGDSDGSALLQCILYGWWNATFNIDSSSCKEKIPVPYSASISLISLDGELLHLQLTEMPKSTYLLILTTKAIYYGRLRFHGAKREGKIFLQRLLSLKHESAVAVRSWRSGFAHRIFVLLKTGQIRVWHSESATESSFQLMEAYDIPLGPVSQARLMLDKESFLLKLDYRLLRIDMFRGQFITLLSLKNERLLHLEADETCDGQLLILTDCHIVLFDHRERRVKAKRKHKLHNADKSFLVQLRDRSHSCMLIDREYGVSTVFTLQQQHNPFWHIEELLLMPGSGELRSAIALQSDLSLNITTLIVSDKQDGLIRLLMTRAAQAEVLRTTEPGPAPKGPVYVDSEDELELEEERLSAIEDGSVCRSRTVELNADRVRNALGWKLDLDEMDEFSVKLFHELGLSTDEHADDTILEQCIARSEAEGIYYSTVSGLKQFLPQNVIDDSDNVDSLTTYELYRTMRQIYSGQRAQKSSRAEQSDASKIDRACRTAAGYLVEATTLFAEGRTVEDDNFCLSAVSNNRYTPITGGIELLVSDWEVGRPVHQYKWQSLDFDAEAGLDEESILVSGFDAPLPHLMEPPQVLSTQPPGILSSIPQEGQQFASQGDLVMTQPVAGKFADRKRKRPKSGF